MKLDARIMTHYGERLKANCIRELRYHFDILSNGLKAHQYDNDIVDNTKWLQMGLALKFAQVREMNTDSEIESFCKKYFNEQTYEKLIEEAKHE